ncbi:MAG: hypothetical protein JWM47_1797, partial [Acidimicrobiales bacterium]|nr:hypothetical protein [Acidimicrobiales bacterium]
LTGLAYAGGKAWVMGAPPDTFGGNLLGLDPGTGTWVVTETDFYDFGLLVSSPQTPNTVVGAETGISAHRLTRWEVSSGTAVKVVSQSEDGFIRDLAISPDGTKLLTTSGSPYHLVERNLSTLAGSGTSYPMAAYPSGVATTTARGGFIAAQANAYYDAVDTWVYRPGAPAAVKKARMAGTPGGGEDPAEGAIDLTADASAVVSISWDSYQDFANPGTVPAYLHILTFVPRISGVTPSILGTRGGGSVNIPGQNLGGVTAVKIGGVHAPMTTKSASSITVTAPALPAGLATVTATEGDTTVSSPLPVRVTALGPFRLGTMFLERQYRDTLGRSPSFAELSTWTGRLATGTAPGALPAGLVTTPTLTRYRSPIIRMLHASNIAFSTASVANWSAKYKAGTSLKAIGDHYAVARYGSMPTRNFVDQIHRNVLGRPATLAELSDWSTRLKTMTRGQMIVAFSESSANITRTTNQVRVTELYIAMLRRVPTLAEAKTSASTTDVATTLLTSTPYASRYPSG